MNAETIESRWALPAFLLACAAWWLVTADYDGIIHDGTLYTFQAMAHLSPAALGHDIALEFGSQDRYTVFSRLYAPLIGWLGIEDASLVLTLVSQALLLAAVGYLAVALLGKRRGWLGFALVLVLPSGYGAERVFRYFEMFPTPRPLAEACVLVAIGACVSRRAWLVLVSLIVGVLLHPVIAAPGCAIAALLWISGTRPWAANARGLAAIAAAGFALALAATPLLPRMDDEWLRLVRDRVPYLFPTTWSVTDFELLAPRAATLIVGARLCAEPVFRRLLAIVLGALVAGLLASALFADTLHVALAVAAQFWRATWIASLIAALALAPLTFDLWRDERGRVVLLLLAGAWISDSTVVTFTLSATAAGAASIPAAWVSGRSRQWIAAGLLAVAAASALGSVFELARSDFLWEPRVGIVINWLRGVALSPLVDLAFAAGVYLLCTHLPRRAARLALAAVFAVAVAGLAPYVYADWMGSQLPRETYAKFAPWRSRIPPAAEVYCGDDARTCWFLLGRSSYMSATQSVNVVFSRAAAMEMERRARELSALTEPSFLMSWRPHAGLGGRGVLAACRDSRVDYLVLPREMSVIATDGREPAPTAELGNLRLYQCPERRADRADRS